MKKIYISLLCFGAMAATSCSDYLDVRPKGEKVENEQFETAKGFEDAIYGVYGSMADGSLYGRDLLWGVTEILSQNVCCSSQYAKALSSYDYTNNSEVRGALKNIWSTAYKSIGYANNVIYNLDKKSPDDLLYYNQYRGEMLAVRALIHFDLLRLFASTDESKRGIPYVTTFNFSVKPFSTVGECYEKIIKDLTEAETLLASDEDIVVYPHDNTRYDRFMNWRETHMNLYAIKALLARVYWYRGDMTNAARYACQVIDSGKFPLVGVTDIQNYLAGVLSAEETIFGIYSTAYLETSKTLLYEWSSYVTYHAYDDRSGSSYIDSWENVYNKDVDGTVQDFRKTHFVQNTGYTRILKLVDSKSIENSNNVDDSKISGVTVMHSSEMYLIAAEALLDVDYDRALGYFNDEITSRGLSQLRPDETLTKERIYNEYRKELFCEGQTWYNMKRTNRDITSNYENRIIPASESLYVLPIPNEEFEYRPEGNK